jgi:uncharacterized protein
MEVEGQIGRRNFTAPPLHLWHPALSGDIPIRITADGTWHHDGGVIQRESLVRLFASILRREDNGEYYLVTPAEKWRIEVELHPLLVTDISQGEEAGGSLLQATLNTGTILQVGEVHPLRLDPSLGHVPVLQLDHGLSALFSRAAWYRLADMAREIDGVPTVSSGGYRFALASQQ